ncbi:acyltransferase [uncultured Acetobacteroides sp.]|uniref:acyltransferase n=1 Tax=uncultured Acetobacteroides sp. TaxID=1760811 RepID=UPI0029F47A89|nr:acyltransferase [uncultured Acetobacteroides sp.]
MEIDKLQGNLPETMKVEMSDAIQFFLRSNADQQIRFVIYLSQQLDFDILEKAVCLSIYQEPIFSYTYKEAKNAAYWKKQDNIKPSMLVDLVKTATPSNEVEEFLTTAVSPFDFPLVRVRIVRHEHKDILCINMNHTPTDGAGLKEFVKILADSYSKLAVNPNHTCQPNISGDRSIKQVTKRFSLLQKMKFARAGFKRPPRRVSWSFDWGQSNEDGRNQLAFMKLSSDTFDRVKAFGKRHNATINDVVIAAFTRAFVKARQNNETASKPLIVPVDLRKYADPSHKRAICSLTGSMIINLETTIGESFAETLSKTVKETSLKKSTHAEMNMLAPFLVLSRLMPYAKMKEKVMQLKMPPIPLLTNVGVINPNDINFNGIPVESSFITGVVSYGGYFSMAYSTFNREITFSIGFCGNTVQQQKVNTFLSNLKSELEGIE